MRILRICVAVLICFVAIAIGIKVLEDVNRIAGASILALTVSLPFWFIFIKNRITNWWALMPAWLLPVEVLFILKLEGTTNELIGTAVLSIIALPYFVYYTINRRKLVNRCNVIMHSLSGSLLVIGVVVIYLISWPLASYSGIARAIAYGDSFAFKIIDSRVAENEAPVFYFGLPSQGFASNLSDDYMMKIVNSSFSNSKYESFEDFLTKSGTTSFLVIQNDALLYEWYGNGYNHDSIVTSFSVAKSFTSALVGFAIDDGYISSVNDSITKYIPELMERDKRFDEITIKHLLTMTSGIGYNHDSPLGDGMKTTHALDMRKSALSVQIEQPPGESFLYNNYNPLLLGLILERTTGKSVTEYLEEKIWRPLGMEAPGSWSLDSEKSGFEKMSVGVNGRAIDFAKFGRLYLNYGNWNGKQLLSSDWVKASTEIDNTSDLVQDYKYAWWINGKWFAAEGAYGQYICASPEQNIIIVRFGINDDTDKWVKFFNGIIDSIRK